VSESVTKVILFLLKKSISLEDQPPSGPITFQKISPFLFTNSCCFLNHWFKSYSFSSLVTEIEILSLLSLLFSQAIISMPFKIDGFHNLSLCSTASLIIEFHLKSFFENIQLQLVDFKLEFGYDFRNNIILGDEISPDNCRLWDLNQKNDIIVSLDKDRFRNDLGGLIEAYSEIHRRINDFLKPN